VLRRQTPSQQGSPSLSLALFSRLGVGAALPLTVWDIRRKKNQTSLQTMEEMISKVRCGEGPLAFRGSPSHRVPDSGSRLPSPSRIDSLKVRGGTRKAEGVGRIHDRNRNRKHSNVACFDWRLVAFAATYGVHPSLLRCLLLVGTRYCT